jgi:hypothetical protein
VVAIIEWLSRWLRFSILSRVIELWFSSSGLEFAVRFKSFDGFLKITLIMVGEEKEIHKVMRVSILSFVLLFVFSEQMKGFNVFTVRSFLSRLNRAVSP